MGLKESEHIGMIVVDPRDSNVVYVAAQGRCGEPGGDRGLYKTTDGGETWDAHPSRQRRHGRQRGAPRPARSRRACTRRPTSGGGACGRLINGGPESAIHKSTDGGSDVAQDHAPASGRSTRAASASMSRRRTRT